MTATRFGLLVIVVSALCILVLGFARGPQEKEPLEERVAALEKTVVEQSAALRGLEEEVATLKVEAARLRAWQGEVRRGLARLRRAVGDIERLGFTRAAIPPASREALLDALATLAEDLLPPAAPAKKGQ